jgi:hypothetical protein
MSKIYVYKLTVDDGGAPCISNGTLSLAICKPAIRSNARPDDLILGFAANHLYSDNCLVYMARITEWLDGRTYFSKPTYADRPDCVYEWDGRRFEWKAGSRFHSHLHLEHDLGEAPHFQRAHVLLSGGPENFRYFGDRCPVGYKQTYSNLKTLVESLGQGHRVNFGPASREELLLFMKRLWKVHSEHPVTAPSNTSCHDNCSNADEDFATVDC